MENKAKKDGRKWLENMKKINAPFGDTLCSWNANFFIFRRRISNLNKVILMLYHYNDNDNVLLLKMFQIKYKIEFK